MQRAEPDDKLWYARHHPDRLITPPVGTRPVAQYSRNKAMCGALVSDDRYPVGSVVCDRDRAMKQAWRPAASSTNATARQPT
jgi:hypothetical protein